MYEFGNYKIKLFFEMKKQNLLLLTLLASFILITCKDSGANDTEKETEIEDLVWSDEFDGTTWNREEWYPELGDHGWGNNEWQNYTALPSNIEVSDGTLKIIARKIGNGQRVGDYTSARLLTQDSFLYGRMEIRAKIPDSKGNGLWPAIWMLGDAIRNGTSWPLSGEIDIMEYISHNPDQFYSTIHSEANNHRNGTQIGSGSISLPNIEEEFNNFGIIWREDFIKFYVNDTTNVVFEVNKPATPTAENWPFDKPHFFLLNMAVGGDWGGAEGVDDSIFPTTFEIDYVRVYE